MSELRLRGAFELCDVKLLHLEHGLHCFGVLDEVGKTSGYDLPGEAELVLEPATLTLAAAGSEFRPVVVDLLLGVTAHDKGDGFVEFEERAAIERGELLAIEFEGYGEYVGGRVGSSRAVMNDFETARVFEDGEVKVDGLFGVRIEPEKRRDARIAFENAH
jgi:hypothetical protein